MEAMKKNGDAEPNQAVQVDLENLTYNHPDINRIFVAGTLIQDPPLRRTRKGVPVTNFIVVTRPEINAKISAEMRREPCFISVVVWAKQAVQCSKHLRKGSAVIVLGELQSMPNAKPEDGFFPIQISAQWIQYLEKGRFTKISSDADEDYEENSDLD